MMYNEFFEVREIKTINEDTNSQDELATTIDINCFFAKRRHIHIMDILQPFNICGTFRQLRHSR